MNKSHWRRLTYPLYRALRWAIWGVKWGVIWPLATMMLSALFLMWQGDITPGQMMAQEISEIRRAAPVGQFTVRDCGEPVTAAPVMPENKALPQQLPEVPVLKEDCRVVLTDAAGYAAQVDHSLLQTGKAVWVTLALVYVALAVMTGNIPVKTPIHRRSALLYRQPDGSFMNRNGRPVSPRGTGEYLVVPGVTERDEQMKTVYSAEDAATLMENTNVHILYAGDSVPEKEGTKKHEE